MSYTPKILMCARALSSVLSVVKTKPQKKSEIKIEILCSASAVAVRPKNYSNCTHEYLTLYTHFKIQQIVGYRRVFAGDAPKSSLAYTTIKEKNNP